MGFLDRLAGRDGRPPAAEPDEPASEQSTSGSGTSEVLRDTAPSLEAFQPTNRLYDPYGKHTAVLH
jgi:hypothetical protein